MSTDQQTVHCAIKRKHMHIQLALHWVSTTIRLQYGRTCTALFKWHVYNPPG